MSPERSESAAAKRMPFREWGCHCGSRRYRVQGEPIAVVFAIAPSANDDQAALSE
jgi:hypothetical protein